MALIDQAIARLKALSIQKPNVVLQPTHTQIVQAEEELGIRFPPSFLMFLQHAGSFSLEYWEAHWVGDKLLGHRNIIEANRCEHEEVKPALPSFLVTFHNNGCGDQLCFDTRNADKHGEYPIVFWDHELTAEENIQRLFPVAATFAHWLMQETEDHQ